MSSASPSRVFPPSRLTAAREERQALSRSQLAPTGTIGSVTRTTRSEDEATMRTVVTTDTDTQSAVTTVTTHVLRTSPPLRPRPDLETVLHHSHAPLHGDSSQTEPARLVPVSSSSSSSASRALSSLPAPPPSVVPGVPTVCPLARASVHFESNVSVDETCANTASTSTTTHLRADNAPELCIHQEAFASSDRCAVVSALNFVLRQPTLKTFWRQISINGQTHSIHPIPFSCAPPPALAAAHGIFDAPNALDGVSATISRYHASSAPVRPTLHLLYFPSADDCAACAAAHPHTVFPVATSSTPSASRRVPLEYSCADRQFVVPPRIVGQTEQDLLRALRCDDATRVTAGASNAGLITSPSKDRTYTSIVRPMREQAAATLPTTAIHAAAAPVDREERHLPTRAGESDDVPLRRIGQRLQERFSASASMYHSTHTTPAADPLTVSFLDADRHQTTSFVEPSPPSARQSQQSEAHPHTHLLSLTAPTHFRPHMASTTSMHATANTTALSALSSSARFVSAPVSDAAANSSPTSLSAASPSSSSARAYCVLLPFLHHFDGPKSPLPPVDVRLCHETLRDLASQAEVVICPHQVAFVDLDRVLVARLSQLRLSPAPKTLLRDTDAEHALGFWQFGHVLAADASESSASSRDRGFIVHPLRFADVVTDTATAATATATSDVCVLMFQNVHARNECLAAHPREVVPVHGHDSRLGKTLTVASSAEVKEAPSSSPRYIDVLYSKRDGRFILPPRISHAISARYSGVGGSGNGFSLSDRGSEVVLLLVHLLRKEATTTLRAFTPRIVETTASQRIRHGLDPSQTHRVATTNKLDQTQERRATSLHRLPQATGIEQRAGGASTTQPWLMSVTDLVASPSPSHSSFTSHSSASQHSFASRSFSGAFLPTAFSPRRSSSPSPPPSSAAGRDITATTVTTDNAIVARDDFAAPNTGVAPRDHLAFRFHASAYPALVEEWPQPAPETFVPDVPLDHILAHLELPRARPDVVAERRGQEQLLAAFDQDTGAIFRETFSKRFWWPCSAGVRSRHAAEAFLRQVDHAYRHRAGRDIACSLMRLDTDASLAVTFLQCGRVQHARIVFERNAAAADVFAGDTQQQVQRRGRFRIMAKVLREDHHRRGANTDEDDDGEDADYVHLWNTTFTSLEAIFPTTSSTDTEDDADGECTAFRFPPLIGTTRGLTDAEVRWFETRVDESGEVRVCTPRDSTFPFAPLQPPLLKPVPFNAGPQLVDTKEETMREEADMEDDFDNEDTADTNDALRSGAGRRDPPKAHYQSVRRAAAAATEEQWSARQQQEDAERESASRSPDLPSSSASRKSVRLEFSPPARANGASGGHRSTHTSQNDAFKARDFDAAVQEFSPRNNEAARSPKPTTTASSLNSPGKRVRISQPEVQNARPTHQPAAASDAIKKASHTTRTNESVTVTTVSVTSSDETSVSAQPISLLNAATVSSVVAPHLSRSLRGDAATLASLRVFLCELVWQALTIPCRKSLTRVDGVAVVRDRIEVLVRKVVDQHLRRQAELDEHAHLQSSAHQLIAKQTGTAATRPVPRASPAHLAVTSTSSQVATAPSAAASARLSPSQVSAVAACFGGDTSLAFDHLIGRTYFACTRSRARVEEWLRRQRRDCTLVRLGSQVGTLSLSFVIAGDVQHIRLRFDTISNYWQLLGHHATRDAHGAPVTIDLSMHYFASIPELLQASHIYPFPPLWTPDAQNTPRPHVPTVEELRQMRPMVLQARSDATALAAR